MAEELVDFSEDEEPEDFGEQESDDEQYEERRTKEKALENFQKLKKTSIDFTNYQKIFQEAAATLSSLRLLVGVEDSRLNKIAEDVSLAFNSIQAQNIRRGTGGVYEEPAMMLKQAMDFFEDRKELTELERAYLKVLTKKLYDAFAVMDGIAITNKAIEVMKEILSERINQQEVSIKDWVQSKLDSFAARVKAFEEIEILKEKLVEKDREIAELKELNRGLVKQRQIINKVVPEVKQETLPEQSTESESSEDVQEISSAEQVIDIVGEEMYEKLQDMCAVALENNKPITAKKAHMVVAMKGQKISKQLANKIADFVINSFGD